MYCGSIYPKDKVPRDKFLKKNTNGCYHKICLDCRQYARKSKKRSRKGKDKQLCSTGGCKNIVTDSKKTCKSCRNRTKQEYIQSREDYINLMYIKINELQCCCELCKKIFLKQEGHGFIVVDSLKNITKDMIEFSNLEYDHLTKEEQLAKKGFFYGDKVKGVSKIIDLEKREYESKKCQLLCLYCHVKESERRNMEKNVIRGQYTRHYQYVSSVKLSIGHCELCRTSVDSNNLSYYEFDHIDPSKKVGKISKMAQRSKHLLKIEISKCRLLCRFCHKKHTIYQKSIRLNSSQAYVTSTGLKKIKTDA